LFPIEAFTDHPPALPGAYHADDANRYVLRCTFLVAVVVSGVFPATPVRAGNCALRNGENVVLRSSDFDPDVFVWDSQGRAIAYGVNATFMKVDDVLRHIVLAKPGTHATVVGCHTKNAHEVVLVRLASGPNRGHQGWVALGDIRS
jgi:hypothetical protein